MYIHHYCTKGGSWKWRTWKWRTIEMSRHEIDGHDIDGPNVQAWKRRTMEMSRHEIDGHENDGHENAGHVSGVWIGLHGIDFDLAVLPSNRLLLRFQECWRSKSFRLVIVSTQFFRKTFDINIFNLRYNPTTLNTVEWTVLLQRHLIFLDIHILDIFVDTLYSCVLVLGYAFQLFYNYRWSIQLTALLWLVFCRCFEKNCTLHCDVIYFHATYILSSNFMSVIFMSVNFMSVNFTSVIFSQPYKRV